MKFEQEFQRLESILDKLEGGDLSLDLSLQEYEAGIKALRNCRQLLSDAERRIEELAPGEEGDTVKPFQAGGSE